MGPAFELRAFSAWISGPGLLMVDRVLFLGHGISRCRFPRLTSGRCCFLNRWVPPLTGGRTFFFLEKRK
jgi:hypothetical protein